MSSGGWIYWIEKNTPNEPAANLGFTTKRDRHGNTFHYRSKLGMQVRNPDRCNHMPDYIPHQNFMGGIDPYKDDMSPDDVQVWKKVPSLEELKAEEKAKKGYNLFEKILITLGILTIKKQNER